VPTKKLTDLFVERARAPVRGRVEYFDASFPGLALRVTENGRKSWSLFYRFNGRLRRFTIGRYPAIKPNQARREAINALERVRQGIDPAEEKKTRRDKPSPEAETFEALAQDYLERHVRKNCATVTYQEAKRDLEHNVLPKWRNRPIASISRRDAIDLIDGLVERGVEIQANRTLTRLRALFNWAIEKDRISASPVDHLRPPTKERARDRTLSDDEIRWFWQACDEIGWPFGPVFKLLLLTAQRRDEVGGMKWSEINVDKRTWTLPRHRVKSDRRHEVHLSDTAIEVLRSLPRITSGSNEQDLVFTVTGTTAVSGFGNAKRRFDLIMAEACRRSLRLSMNPNIPDWRLHDLRRTAATGMARLNFPPHVVDKVLNHVSGMISGVAAVYNRFEYLDERRAALEAWGRYVASQVAQHRQILSLYRGRPPEVESAMSKPNKPRNGPSAPVADRAVTELLESLAEQAWQERLAWLRRPRLDTDIFHDAWRDDQTAK
jgi:integrase